MAITLGGSEEGQPVPNQQAQQALLPTPKLSADFAPLLDKVQAARDAAINKPAGQDWIRAMDHLVAAELWVKAAEAKG